MAEIISGNKDNKTTSVLRAAWLIAVVTIVSKLIGFIRDIVIANYYGDIKSEVFVKILDGQTVTTTTASNEITAVLTDDNNNPIIDKTLVLIVNNEEVETAYNRVTGVMTGSYTFTAPGTYEVTAKDFDAEHTTSGTLVYTAGTYTELQNLIDAAEAGATITLDHDIVYNEAFDGDALKDTVCQASQTETERIR